MKTSTLYKFVCKVKNVREMARGGVILCFLFTVQPVMAWNILWDDASHNGRIHSPVICRNLNNNGTVSASFWVHPGFTGDDKFQVKFIETNDSGAEIAQFRRGVYYKTAGITKQIQLHRILPNPSENGYLLLGTAHNPTSGSRLVNSFIISVSSNLNPQSVFFLDSLHQYFDFAISPVSNKIILCGLNKLETGLNCSSRKGVITVLDQSFTCLSINELVQSFPSAGIIPRFDNVKCMKSWYESGSQKEYIGVAGVITEDSIITPAGGGPTTFYIPKTFGAKLELNGNGTVTHSWFSLLDKGGADQFIPTDILIDKNEGMDKMIIIGNLPLTGINTCPSIWGLELGTGASVYLLNSFEGIPLSGDPGVMHLSIYDINLLSNGNYRILGWAFDYRVAGGVNPIDSGYNFYYFDFNPSTRQLATDLIYLIGRTKTYLWTLPTGMISINTDTTYWFYTSSYTNVKIIAYFSPHAMISWVDGEYNDQSTVSWINIGSSNTGVQQLRLKCTLTGVGDDGQSPASCIYQSNIKSYEDVSLANG